MTRPPHRREITDYDGSTPDDGKVKPIDIQGSSRGNGIKAKSVSHMNFTFIKNDDTVKVTSNGGYHFNVNTRV